MASGPITSWEIDGETVETVSDFIFWGGSKITADGDCSHEIKDTPWKKSYKIVITILDAWGWCTGTTQRDCLGREEGGGFRMGNTCIPVADSFRYLAKQIQYCKV